MTSADPGSFRDPASHVVFDGDRVLRLLDERGLAAWRSVSASDFFKRATADGRIISTTETSPPEGVPGALEHPQIPFVSYPYEWTFTMLKDAALLQLELLSEALAAGLTIKDATPFNVQFVSGRPIFIDIGSFEPYEAGEPWIGYRQFTRQFLFPLMMRAWADIPFHPWLRGDMEGPTAMHMSRILPLGKRFRPASLMHVTLQARMEERMSGQSVRTDLKTAGFSAELILANVRRLRKLVARLEWAPKASEWSAYRSCAHVSRDRDAKTDFLRGLLDRMRPVRVLDLGANDGHFSGVAADRGALAVAVDGDELVLDELYRSCKDESISVVVSDLNNPSPSQGWGGVERPGLLSRAQPDLVVAYGLIHHLIYTASIPPRTVIDWLAGFGCPVALEFVAPEDEMVARLTANKLTEELHDGRREDQFRSILAESFEIVSEQRLDSETRVLFGLNPRVAA